MNNINFEEKNENNPNEEQFIFNLKEFQEAFEKFLKAIQNENNNLKDNNLPKQSDKKKINK